ncbi:diaminohydroxyphosphoribosylaminopyrimidine deaminase [Rhizobium grahamii]|uniref:Diaminohydroxyphosphoribosylaminopyrimidine deaminase n=1 Tax=Rhizobium grahamii TaxID=1120045 RepID=A0A5Q0CA42_9HYPH|nr:diaminohydroxyphosphoribosylaminopyrimidine deaminase [Rhizobium grahamii]
MPRGTPSVLPDISPSRGEIGWAHALAPTSIVWRRPRHESISPLEGEMPGRAEGGIPRHTLAVPNPHTL